MTTSRGRHDHQQRPTTNSRGRRHGHHLHFITCAAPTTIPGRLSGANDAGGISSGQQAVVIALLAPYPPIFHHRPRPPDANDACRIGSGQQAVVGEAQPRERGLGAKGARARGHRQAAGGARGVKQLQGIARRQGQVVLEVSNSCRAARAGRGRRRWACQTAAGQHAQGGAGRVKQLQWT